jgi:hypothetical protein
MQEITISMEAAEDLHVVASRSLPQAEALSARSGTLAEKKW